MGFIKVVKRRATRFDNLAKKWKGPLGLVPCPRQVRGHVSLEILTFCSCKDVFFCILKLQTLSFNFHEKITFLDNLLVIWYQYPPHKLFHNLIETFQMLFYGAHFSLQCIMGRFLFLTRNKLGDFMVYDKVGIWRWSMFCIWEDSSRKGYDCIIYLKLFFIVTCNKTSSFRS